MYPGDRTIDYLRISITDRCNARCRYCMPEGYQGGDHSGERLTADEIARVVRVAVGLGFRKFRLTGGEPLVRPDLPLIVRALAATPGIEGVGLTTNGTRLEALAQPLRAAGLRAVNVSLDALGPEVHQRITGGDVTEVLAGLHAALAAGIERVKLNCVLMRGLNEPEIWPLARFAAAHGLPVRFIELMPVTSAGALMEEHFLSVATAMQILREHDELISHANCDLGWGPARYYRLRHTGALVGFIGAMTTPHFCATCNRIRLTADGKLRPCLADHGELDLRAALRQASDDEAVRALLLAARRRKPPAHRFGQPYQPCRPMTAIGG